jgi:hypothetical protein
MIYVKMLKKKQYEYLELEERLEGNKKEKKSP